MNILCAARDCTYVCKDDRPMCVVHWRLVPTGLKQDIHRHARDAKNGMKDSAAELARSIDLAAKAITSAEAKAREAAGQLTMFADAVRKGGNFHD